MLTILWYVYVALIAIWMLSHRHVRLWAATSVAVSAVSILIGLGLVLGLAYL